MSKLEHAYEANVRWEGNRGTGTSDYASYGRGYRMAVAGKSELVGSADPAFRGEGDKHNPEDLFLLAISSCHLLSYLALCGRQRVQVVAYEDHARGTLRLDGSGGGRFEEVTLHPKVTVARPEEVAAATDLHAKAHAQCFIANSCSVPIRVVASVQVREQQG